MAELRSARLGSVTGLHAQDASLHHQRGASWQQVFAPLPTWRNLLFTGFMIWRIESMSYHSHCFSLGGELITFSSLLCPLVFCSPPSPYLSFLITMPTSPLLSPHSSLNSVNSSDSRSSGSHSHSPSSHYRCRSSNLTQQAPVRLSSVSSHDSGFISQDAFQSKSPSPMPPEAPSQVRVPLAQRAAIILGASCHRWLGLQRDIGLDRPLSRNPWFNFLSSDVLLCKKERTWEIGFEACGDGESPH